MGKMEEIRQFSELYDESTRKIFNFSKISEIAMYLIWLYDRP